LGGCYHIDFLVYTLRDPHFPYCILQAGSSCTWRAVVLLLVKLLVKLLLVMKLRRLGVCCW